ncbi:NAD(P)/FAD-dependent oxidoreductase [Nocardioides koreensis]|uniref:NAD(P)/FAD-dependent oxidoreductase n=1 Tax=Nocardioides koreensis TaxID=433651 RepID=A0ABP5LX66_9ACTN
MSTIDTIVIGAGHAGLAVSRLLSEAGRDHVVMDRGRIAERWRSERWDSLHLLTPRWMTRLPGWRYPGEDQDGFMPAAELVGHLEQYAAANAAPLVLGDEVHRVTLHRDRYRVETGGRSWKARHVVVATGATGRANVPAGMDRLDPDIALVTSAQYRNPDQLPPGGVLVVGASASGSQIADELARAGRRVVLAVGRHTRLPRTYRGMDVFWWLEQTGRLARQVTRGEARVEPSLQLVGREPADPRGSDVDLATLQRSGVELAGRLGEVAGHRVGFRDDLAASTHTADQQMFRFLDSVDRYVDLQHLGAEVDPAVRPPRVATSDPLTHLDLRAAGIGTVVLATGFRPHHPWLRIPVVGSDGAIQQERGVTAAPGLYVVGQRFQHRRDSTFIDGARFGARDVVSHLCGGELAAGALEEAS